MAGSCRAGKLLKAQRTQHTYPASPVVPYRLILRLGAGSFTLPQSLQLLVTVSSWSHHKLRGSSQQGLFSCWSPPEMPPFLQVELKYLWASLSHVQHFSFYWIVLTQSCLLHLQSAPYWHNAIAEASRIFLWLMVSNKTTSGSWNPHSTKCPVQSKIHGKCSIKSCLYCYSRLFNVPKIWHLFFALPFPDLRQKFTVHWPPFPITHKMHSLGWLLAVSFQHDFKTEIPEEVSFTSAERPAKFCHNPANFMRMIDIKSHLTAVPHNIKAGMYIALLKSCSPRTKVTLRYIGL